MLSSSKRARGMEVSGGVRAGTSRADLRRRDEMAFENRFAASLSSVPRLLTGASAQWNWYERLKASSLDSTGRNGCGSSGVTLLCLSYCQVPETSKGDRAAGRSVGAPRPHWTSRRYLPRRICPLR